MQKYALFDDVKSHFITGEIHALNVAKYLDTYGIR
jgi:hypothetical protein